jgi:hypothetical protein
MFASFRLRNLVGLVAGAGVVIAGVAGSVPARANDDWAAPFIGGIMAGHVLSRFGEMQRERTQAMQEMAQGGYGGGGGGYGGGMRRGYGYERPMQAPAPAPQPAAAPLTAEQKLQQLGQLAAGGYITPQEYKERRQAILNSL